MKLTPTYSLPNQPSQRYCDLDGRFSYTSLGIMLVLTSLLQWPAYSAETVGADATTRETHGVIEMGIASQSDDSPWFGRYTGLTEAGEFVTGEMDILSKTEDGSSTELVGRRLGLDSRSILLQQGTQGKYRLKLRYDELPYYQFENAVTPYQNTGDNILSLPGSVLDPGNYQPVDLRTGRKRSSAELRLYPQQHWKTSLSFRQEKRDGTLQTGGGLGYSTRNMALSMLPEPVDYTTNLIDAKASYNKDKGHLELAYHLSAFRNDNQSLSWENPYPDLSGNAGQYGQLALEPDNDFQQLMLSGAYQLPHNSYLSAVLSSGLMTQDQPFLPYTTNPAINGPALPRESLDGEVRQNIAQFKLSSRPLRDWNFNASYRYHDHDNNTPLARYTFPIADSLPPGKTGKPDEDLSAINQPLSYTRQTTRLDGRYRFNRAVALQLGYDFENTDRENSEVEQTDEQTLWGKLKWKAQDTRVDGWIRAGRTNRDGSGYHPTVDRYDLYIDNPLLRKYNLADLARDELRVQLNYSPLDRLSFAANLAYSQGDYSESLIGLSEASNRSATIEASYAPTDNVSTYAYYTRDLIESAQTGREVPASTTSNSFDVNHQADWAANSDDTMDNFGIGSQWQNALPKLDLGADYVYANTRGTTELAHVAASPFPDLTTDLYSLKLFARYRQSNTLSYKITYWRDRYDSQDWALDGTNPTSADYPTSLFMVRGSPDYDVNIIMLSLRYDF